MLLQDLPIQNKLMRFIILISGIVLLTTFLTFFIFELYTFQKSTIEKLTAIGKIISYNSSAALAFNNHNEAKIILEALKSEPHIIAASLYNKQGKLFAQYPSNVKASSFPSTPKPLERSFTGLNMEIILPISQGNTIFGWLYLKSDRSEMYERLKIYSIISATALILSFLFAYLLSINLKNNISQPIQSLVKAAKTISEKGDYSIRAGKQGKDELGIFTDTFNQMLTTIENQNKALNEFNKNLEQKVKERTISLEQVNKELKESEQQIQSIFNSAPDPVIIINTKSIIEKWNHKAEKLFGWTESEVLGKPIYEYVIPERYREAHKKGMAHYLATGEGPILNRDLEIEAINKSGIEYSVLLSISPVQIKDKILLIGFIRDITEDKKTKDLVRKKTEETNQLNAFLDSVLENIPNMIFVKEAKELRFVRFNKAGEELLGYTKQELIGKNDYDFFTKSEADFFTANDRKVLTSGKLLEIREEPIHTKNKGERILETKKIPILNKDGKPIYLLGISNDITEQKKTLMELEKKSKELERSNKELEQFAYIASHDLQEPLRMVNSYLQLLEKRYKDKLDKDANDFINYAVDGSNRMRTLIFALLDYSRVNRIKPFEDIHVNELISEVLKDLANQIKENNANIIIETLPDIFGDRVLISQLFQNLISNSVKFKGERNPEILITGKKENNEFLFSVKDNGIGIQNEYASKLFTIFQRLNTKEQYPGTGIGLAICKKIVERHGGKIWFESEFGKGTTFYFTIKAKEEKPTS